MKLTGHKTDRVFRDYNISTFEDRKASVAKVAAYIARVREETKRARSNGEGGTQGETSHVRAVAPASRLTRHPRFGVLTVPVSRPLRKNGDTTVTLENFSKCREERRTPRENLVNSNIGEVAERSKAHASKACAPSSDDPTPKKKS